MTASNAGFGCNSYQTTAHLDPNATTAETEYRSVIMFVFPFFAGGNNPAEFRGSPVVTALVSIVLYQST